MTTSPQPRPDPEVHPHHSVGPLDPLASAVTRARQALLDVLDRPAWPLDAAATRALLVEISALACQVAEVELRVLDRACRGRAGEDVGATSTATWLAHATRQTARSTHAKARLAADVVADDTVRRAMGRGDLLPDQARAVLDASRHPAADRPPGVVDHLVAEAASHNAPVLRIMGRAATGADGAGPATADAGPDDVGTGDVTNDAEPGPSAAPASLLVEDDASRTCRLAWTLDDAGMARGHFVVPRDTADALAQALTRHGLGSNGSTASVEARGRAFCALVDELGPPGSPESPESPESPGETQPARWRGGVRCLSRVRAIARSGRRRLGARRGSRLVARVIPLPPREAPTGA